MQAGSTLVVWQIFCVGNQFLASQLAVIKQGTKESWPNFFFLWAVPNSVPSIPSLLES